MTNIAYIGPIGKGEVTPAGEPLISAIEILEDLLAQAQSGKLCAIAVASVVEEGLGITERQIAYKGGRFADLYVATDQLMGRLRKRSEEA